MASLVQSVGAASTTNVTSLGVTITPTTGNNLIATVIGRNTTNAVTGPAGWTRVCGVTFNNFDTSIWVLENYSGSGAQTYTWAQTASDTMSIVVMEWNGLVTASSTDQTATNTSPANTASNPVDSGTTATTTQANEVWIAAMGSAATGNRAISGVTSGWTQDLTENTSGGAHETHITDLYQIVSATGVANAQFTLSTAQEWNGCVATFKIASGGGGPVLAGESDAVATATVDATISHPLVGEADALTTASASLSVAHALVAESDSVSGATAAVTVAHPLVGVASSASGASIGVTISHALAGESDAVAGASVAVLTGQLAFASNAVATASASVTVAHALAGASDALAGAGVGLTVAHPLSAESDALAGATALVSVAHPLVAESDALATAGVALAISHALVGEADSVTTASIGVSVSHALVGASDAVGGAALMLAIAHALRGESNTLATALMTLTTGVLPPPPGVWHGAAILATVQPFAAWGATTNAAAQIAVTSNSQPAIESVAHA